MVCIGRDRKRGKNSRSCMLLNRIQFNRPILILYIGKRSYLLTLLYVLPSYYTMNIILQSKQTSWQRTGNDS